MENPVAGRGLMKECRLSSGASLSSLSSQKPPAVILWTERPPVLLQAA